MTDPSFVVEVHEPGRLPLRLVVSGRLPIGRAGEGLLLTDQRLSRNHCELRVERGRLVVQDGGSSNGTFVDGVLAAAPIELQVGDEVTLGATRVVVEADLRAVADPAAHETLLGTLAGAVPEGRAVDDLLARSVVGGTVSMAFTDIVGSTALNGELGDRTWFDLLGRHDELVRASVAANGGTEVKGQGDGFLLTFASARRALCFATELQAAMASWRAEEGAPLHVRIGLHTGEVIRDGGDLFGRHVNYAARVAAQAGADEILVSELVHELAAPMGDFRFGPPQPVALKGFEGLHHVRRVE